MVLILNVWKATGTLINYTKIKSHIMDLIAIGPEMSSHFITGFFGGNLKTTFSQMLKCHKFSFCVKDT